MGGCAVGKILFIGWNGWGHVNPTLSILEKLNRNNKVIYLNAPRFNDVVKKTGVKVINNRYMNLVYKFFDSNISTFTKRLSEAEFIDNVTQFYEKTNYLFLLLDQVAKVVDEIKPDLIVHDSCAHVVKYMFRKASIPRISVLTLFAIKREMLLEDKFFLEKLYGLNVDSTNMELIQKVDDIARKCEQRTGFYYDYFDSFSCEEGLNFVLTAKDFQPYTDLIDNKYIYIGNDISYRKDKEDLFVLPNVTCKKVLISLGSVLSGFSYYQDIYCQLIERLKDIEALFILVKGELKEIKTSIPSNFIVVNSVPQLRTLESVDLFVTHGGFNSVSEAIINEVPMIVLPQIADQYIVAKQVEEKKLGCALWNHEINVDELTSRIKNIIENNLYSKELHVMKRKYIESREAIDLDELINNYCNK